MIDRLLLLGNQTAQLERHVAYALELGAEVLHVGDTTVYPRVNAGVNANNAPHGYHFLPLGRFADLRPKEAGAHARFNDEVAKLAAVAADFAPDLIHVLGIDIYFYLARSARLHPLVVSAYGYLYHWLAEPHTLGPRDEWLFEADALHIESPALIQIGRDLLPASLQVVEFAAGLDSRHFFPARAEQRAAWRRALRLPPEATIIFSPRGWAPAYHHDRILAAFAQILPALPAPAYLLFVKMGRDWDSARSKAPFDSVVAQADQLGISDHVRYLPHFPAVTIATLYNVADLAVSYAMPDTFPHTLLELMACETPVIAPDLPAFAHSVLAEHCRLVPAPDQPDAHAALAAAMLDSILHPPTPTALAEARRAVLARYDKPVVIAQLAAHYEQVVAAYATKHAAPP